MSTSSAINTKEKIKALEVGDAVFDALKSLGLNDDDLIWQISLIAEGRYRNLVKDTEKMPDEIDDILKLFEEYRDLVEEHSKRLEHHMKRLAAMSRLLETMCSQREDAQ